MVSSENVYLDPGYSLSSNIRSSRANCLEIWLMELVIP